MAPPSQSHQSYEYLDALLTAIPNDSVPPEIASPPQSAHRPYSQFLDTALRLVSGGPARPDDATHIRDAWPEIQASVLHALHALHASSTAIASTSSQKRKHSPSVPDTNNKRPKFGDGGENDADDDVPQLTLHALSATAPVRHKIDIALHTHTLRLAHSTTGAQVAQCARTALTRVFLLPTRARSSGALQWTALLLAGDKPAPPPPRGAGSKEAKAAAGTAVALRFELACSVPDSSKPAVIPRMTVHTPTSASQATSTRDALLALLTPTISDIQIPLTTVERGAQLAGITAFRGVRETSLWFFDDAGILADGRPAEFWAVADLARGEAGVRVRTATGRTCSVVFMRQGEHDGNEDGGEDEEEEGEETEFQMIDGKERERIIEWVRRNRGSFGIANVREDDGAREPQGAAAKGKENGKGQGQGAGAGQEPEEGIDGRGEGDSDSDSDFEESGESDGGSPSSGSGSDSASDAGSEHEARSGSGSESGGGGDGSGRDDEDEDDPMELEPKHHPLLRAGGLPKMSRSAMDAAVELLVGDLVGDAPRDDDEDELED